MLSRAEREKEAAGAGLTQSAAVSEIDDRLFQVIGNSNRYI